MGPDNSDLVERYEAMVAAGDIESDSAQKRVVAHLNLLRNELENRSLAKKSSALGWLFARREHEHRLKGLYIHGSVGRGKTMLMDLFYQSLPNKSKKRVHFHEFMIDIHDRIYAWRQKSKRGEVKGEDPIAPVAADIAKEANILCFDEFQVNDIADAMIIGRLFSCLFNHRVIVIATSNTTPENLYRDGLNRALFLPFIDMIRDYLDIDRLDARTDFRLEKLAGQPVYFLPLGKKSNEAMDLAWLRWSNGKGGQPTKLDVKGRSVQVPSAVNGAARFTFADLCAHALGAADYLKIARTYHTVFIDRIPALGPDRRNEARRFINLIDAFYDNNVKLIASAAVVPAALYAEGDGAISFTRTASRLIEMRSDSYLAAPHRIAKRAAS